MLVTTVDQQTHPYNSRNSTTLCLVAHVGIFAVVNTLAPEKPPRTSQMRLLGWHQLHLCIWILLESPHSGSSTAAAHNGLYFMGC